jgi:hypothetical protein
MQPFFLTITKIGPIPALALRIFHSGHSAEQRKGEATSDHGADLRHLARRAEPV